MAKEKYFLETWSTKHKKTGNRIYYMHRVYANGNLGEKQSWSSRSGRSYIIRQMKQADRNLTVVQCTDKTRHK